jgi:hypothetical protein
MNSPGSKSAQIPFLPMPTASGHPEQLEPAANGPKTRLYDHLNINWKFGLHNYSLIEKPTSPTQPAAYRFGVSGNEKTAHTLQQLVFGATQGLSKKVYKLYTVGLIFNGMTHLEAADYCTRHSSLKELEQILRETHGHGIPIPWSGGNGEKVIKGGQLESVFEDLENRFNHLLFGVCSGMMESYYLVVVSKYSIHKTDFGDVLGEMERECSNSDVIVLLLPSLTE